MIFVIKQGNFIYVTQKKRDLDSNDYTESELLMTLTDWTENDLNILIDCLRPYKDLFSSELRFKYCDDVLNIIESHPTSSPKYSFAYKKDVEEVVQEFSDCVKNLVNFEIIKSTESLNLDIDEILKNTTYRCDILNIISSIVGDSFDIVEKFMNLKKNEKDLILTFYSKTSKQERLDHLQEIVTVDIDRVLPFIPKWYRTNLRLFGLDYQPGFDRFKFALTPEYNNDERLDGNSVVLENQDYYIKKEVYKEFQLDEVWKGKDIKAKFGEIYERLKTPKNSRVHDIFNYFNTAITRNGYKLLSRKII